MPFCVASCPHAKRSHRCFPFTSRLSFSFSSTVGTFKDCPREAEDLLNVNISPLKTAEMKLMGEPANIRPREEAGWYVPPLPEAAAKPEADCKQTLQSAFVAEERACNVRCL